jgi:flagellar motor protein MotB
MSNRNVAASALLGFLAVLVSTGCDSSQGMQIAELQRQNDALERQNADLESQLTLAMRDGEDARRRALQLQQMLDQCRSDLLAAQNQPAQVASGVPEGWTKLSEQVAVVELASDILFDSGRATLKKSGSDKINQIASQINGEFGGRQIWVIGHTDNVPITKTKNLWKDNLDLSLNRGATVARALFDKGISAEHTVVGGQGQANPKTGNDTDANKAINRRVEIYAVDASVFPN